jgi:hypothetical protein
VLACAPLRWTEAKNNVVLTQTTSGWDPRLTTLRKLRRRVDAAAPAAVYVIHDSEGVWPEALLPVLLYPRPFLNPWPGAPYPSPPAAPPVGADGVLFLTLAPPPFEAPTRPLPSGLAEVDSRRPLLFRFVNPNGVEGAGETAFSWLGDAPARAAVWAPRDGVGLLRFATAPGPGLPAAASRRLAVRGPGGVEREIVVAPSADVAVPVAVRAGVNRVELRCLDAPAGPPAPLLRASQMRFEMVEDIQPGGP